MMSDYAVFTTGGKQYRVRPGDTIEVERLDGEAGSRIEFTDVLMTSLGGEVAVGKPRLDGAKVVAEIVAQKKGPKVTVFKYKAKTRMRRKRGHRQQQTAINIKEIAAA